MARAVSSDDRTANGATGWARGGRGGRAAGMPQGEGHDNVASIVERPVNATPWQRAMLVAALSIALRPGAAAGEIYKCTGDGGHVTYQESPCAGGQKGSAVELRDAVTPRPSPSESMWSIPARERRAVVGMPKPFVTEALGKPSEIRAPRAGESGTEVWVYPKPGQVTRIGFQNNAIAWMRSDSTLGEPRAAAGKPADREARVREALQVGRECTAVLQEAGSADREEPLVAGASNGTRYVYAFDASDANAYAAFVCLAGRVTSVERFTPEKIDRGDAPARTRPQ